MAKGETRVGFMPDSGVVVHESDDIGLPIIREKVLDTEPLDCNNCLAALACSTARQDVDRALEEEFTYWDPSKSYCLDAGSGDTPPEWISGEVAHQWAEENRQRYEGRRDLIDQFEEASRTVCPGGETVTVRTTYETLDYGLTDSRVVRGLRRLVGQRAENHTRELSICGNPVANQLNPTQRFER